jgi:diguanylate cyclase (GGDEF)-like protein/PAS domain S-box-containing protein
MLRKSEPDLKDSVKTPYRVLVVDDDASIRATYRHILQPPKSELGGLEALISGAEDAGEATNLFQVIEADQGEAAVRLQRTLLDEGLRFPLAFIDMRMPPGWDGMRTAVALRAQDPSVYIVIATAFSDYDVNELQRALGHDVVLLRKPFNQEEVFQLARTLCQSWETRQRLEKVTLEMDRRVQARTAELDRRIALQEVLVEVITRFVEAGADNDLDDAVIWSLARFGRAADVDICGLYQFNAELDCYQHSHEWLALGVKPTPDSLRQVARAEVAPAHARFLKGESFQFNHLQMLPDEMSGLRQNLQGLYESILAVPLEISGRLVGFIAVGMVRSVQPFDAGLASLLMTVGHAITSALEANDSSRKLRESQAMLARSERVTHIGSWELEVATDTVKWSDEMFRLFQLPASVRAPSLAEQAHLFQPEDMQRLLQVIALAIERGDAYELKLHTLRQDGVQRICLARGYAEMGAEGRATRLFGSFQDITELELAKQALQFSEERYRNIIETAYEGILQVNADWKTIYVNQRMEMLLGCVPGSMLGRPMSDFMDQAGREVAAQLEFKRELGARELHEFCFVCADGNKLHTLVSMTPMFDSQGDFAGATAMVTDISQRIYQESVLIATADLVSAPCCDDFCTKLVSHVGRMLGMDYVHVARLSSDGLRVTTEAAWLDGQLIANWSYALTATPCAQVVSHTRQCIVFGVTEKYPDDADLRNIGAEGYVGECIANSRGQVLGLIVAVTRTPLKNRDMVQANLRILAARTAAEWEQRNAIQALALERDNTRNILQTAEAIIVTFDMEGRISLINKKGCDLLGYSEAELIGCDWFAHFLPETVDSDAIHDIFRKALAQDLMGSEYYENPVRTRSGELRLIAWHNSTVRDAEGNVVGAMSAGVDVTEQRRAEQRLRISEERFHRLFDDTDALSIQGYRPDGTVVYWNRASEAMYGYSAAEAVGRNVFDLIIPESKRDGFMAAMREMFASEQPVPAGRLLRRDKNAASVPVYSSHTVVHASQEDAILFCMDIDMRLLEHTEAELKVALTKYKTLFDCFPMGITVTDPQGRVLETNRAAEHLLGLSPGERPIRYFDSQDWRIVRNDGTPMPREEFASVRALKEQKRVENVEMGIVKTDNTTTWISVTADLLPLEGYGVVITYADITARRKAEERIHQLAFLDPLTNLPNRRLMMDRLRHAMASSQRSREFGALLMLDLDAFKAVNDTCGHDVGDQLLIEVAQRLLKNVRLADTVARLGGDEYIVLLSGLSIEHAETYQEAKLIAEKICHALAQPFVLSGTDNPTQISASIGLALFQGIEQLPETVLKLADIALYQAKADGGNQVRMAASAVASVVTSVVADSS